MSRAPAPSRIRRRNSASNGCAIASIEPCMAGPGLHAPYRFGQNPEPTAPWRKRAWLLEEVAQFVHEGLRLRVDLFAELLGEGLEELALAIGELGRHLDRDLDALVAAPDAAAVGDALALDAQDRPRLGPA